GSPANVIEHAAGPSMATSGRIHCDLPDEQCAPMMRWDVGGNHASQLTITYGHCTGSTAMCAQQQITVQGVGIQKRTSANQIQNSGAVIRHGLANENVWLSIRLFVKR